MYCAESCQHVLVVMPSSVPLEYAFYIVRLSYIVSYIEYFLIYNKQKAFYLKARHNSWCTYLSMQFTLNE